MNQVFFDVLNQYIVVYLEDTLVYIYSLWEHLHHLYSILTHLCTHQLCAKIKKYAFLQSKVNYVGHIIGHG